eukprot:TRINITY_DN105637_c1_g1_i1.p2 TRINITY_DN105637_c1_g1~~TRINITY_DN105637_c1_g1_i1.p2  ORF type:complete len:496 (+),score=45.28 TRINITY_DN105637_c1_g1_i1:2582-4069(+)
MMKLAILAIASVLCLAYSLPYSTIERKSLTYYPENNFYLLGMALDVLINGAKNHHMIKHSVGSTSLDFIIENMKGYRLLLKDVRNVMVHDTVVTYQIPTAFSFFMEVNYVVTLGVLPLSGACVFKLTAEDVTYNLDFQEKTVLPTFGGKWRFEIFNITNSVALHLGVRSLMQSASSAVEGYFNKLIEKILQTDIKLFYEDYFGDSNYYIHFPYLRNSTITVAHKFDKLAVGNIARDPIVTAHYDQHFDPVPGDLSTVSDKEFLRRIKYDINTLANILEWEIYLANNVELTQSDIPEKCFFQADIRSATRVLPDLLQEHGNAPVTISFNGHHNKISATYSAEKGTIFIEGIVLSATVALTTPKTPLFRTAFSVSGEFAPVFYTDPHDKRRIFMNLQAVEAKAQILSGEKLWDNEYAVFNEEAIKDYVNDMVKDYFVKYHGKEVLGTGMLVSFGFPVDLKKIEYESNTGKDLSVYLFSIQCLLTLAMCVESALLIIN